MHVDAFVLRKHLRARVWDCKTGEEAGSCSSWHHPSQDDNTETYLVSTCRSMIPSRVNTVSALSSISGGARGKEPACQCRRQELDPWVRKIPWRREWQPTPVLCLEKPMDRGGWWATVHGIAKSRMQLSNFASTLSLGCLWLFQSEVPSGDPAHTFIIWISFS